MISAQIDELRQMADGQATYRDARAVMLQAADTIWQLRDDLQRANAENAKLRDGANAMRQLYEDELKHALAENAKLRELVRDLWDACPADGYYCIYHCEHYDKESESHCKLEDRMRELGVEVDA